MFPLGLLMGWNHPPAKSIAFQYVTTLLPILLLAAIAGARRLAAEREAAVAERPRLGGGDLSAGLAALASCLVASTFFGALPWSSPTLAVMRAQTYQIGDGPSEENPRRPGTVSHRALNEIVALVNSRQSSVVASGRIAAHLLNVRRLETVEQAVVRWDALCAEAGSGRSGSEVFDWIVVDTCERFQQSLDKMEFILADARRAGYRAELGPGRHCCPCPPRSRWRPSTDFGDGSMRGRWWLVAGGIFRLRGCRPGSLRGSRAENVPPAIAAGAGGAGEAAGELGDGRGTSWFTPWLVCVGIIAASRPRRTFDAAAAAFCGGVVIFSGGLYTYVLTGA